jgi:hypothetical protein
MSDVNHGGFQIRILVEQIVSMYDQVTDPRESGTRRQTIVHHEEIVPIKTIEFSEALKDPVKAVQEIREHEKKPKLGDVN